MLSAITSLQLINRNIAQSKATVAADPTVARETAYYQANISAIKTSADFVDDYRVFSYAMNAYGLGDMIYAKAFMRHVLDGGVAHANSMANQLSDPRFKAFAAAFDFGDKSAAATAGAAAAQAVTDRYIEQTLEDNTGQQNQGAQLALYFQRQAPHIKSGMDILADKALSQFVQTAFNIPVSASASIDSQAAYIESKVHIADLQDPAKVAALVSRFAVMWDLQNNNAVAANPSLSLLSASSPASSGFSTDLLNQIQLLHSHI